MSRLQIMLAGTGGLAAVIFLAIVLEWHDRWYMDRCMKAGNSKRWCQIMRVIR
jgi:hypothetical protein